jgi:hypothetical protein
LKATVAFGKKYEHADSKVGVSRISTPQFQQTAPSVGITATEAIESVSTAATSPEVPDTSVSSESD